MDAGSIKTVLPALLLFGTLKMDNIMGGMVE
jgi:hypothetical protein